MLRQRQTAEEIFCDALDLAPAERSAFLSVACRDSPELRPLVHALLEEERLAGSFLKRPVLDCGPALLDGSSVGDAPSSQRGDVVRNARFCAGDVLADRFTVVRFLARGGMGEVYEAADGLLQGEHVALKTIRPEIAEEAGSTHRFEQEVLLARRVHHPNLCPIYEIFRCEEPGPPFLFLTMKLLRGDTLDVHLRCAKARSRAEIVEICDELMAGVAALHAAGVLHRDIKPKNVMLVPASERTEVYLLDFGLARLHEAEATVLRTGMVAGTPGYLAPELLWGQGPTRATDLFALGVVLHQVLCGALPLVTSEGLAPLPDAALAVADAPERLIEAVAGLLSQDPATRCRAFAAARGGDGAAMLPVPVPAAAPRLRLPSRRAFVAGSVGALTAAAVWRHDWVYDRLHPLPQKRFVALLDWPPSQDPQLRPTLLGLIDSIASELARAEAFDHDLLVMAQTVAAGQTPSAALRQVRDSLGANLVLAASGERREDRLQLALQVVDASSGKTLRERAITTPLTAKPVLAERVVRAASELLDVRRYEPDERRLRPGTDQPKAFAAFQAAEVLLREDNDAGLDAAIDKYRDAVDLDPHFALASAKLAQAYGRSFILRRNTGALHLALANCEHALALDSQLIEGHLARALLLEHTGEEQAALDEMTRALALDPTNPKTLLWQARIYRRLNRWPEAEQAFHRVLQLRPNLWLLWNELGYGLHGQGRWRDALEAFRTATVAAPGNAMAAANLGAEFLEIGDTAQAMVHLQRSLSLQPKNDLASADMSLALRYERRFAEALPFALEATGVAPEEDANWLELGDCYASLPHRGAEARAAYLRAVTAAEEHLRSDASNGPAWMLLALYQALTGSSAKAVASLEKAKFFRAEDMDSELYRVRVLEALGRRDEALAVVQRCFARGATPLQVAPVPELEAMRADPRYKALHAADGLAA